MILAMFCGCDQANQRGSVQELTAHLMISAASIVVMLVMVDGDHGDHGHGDDGAGGGGALIMVMMVVL
jgi:hypothetical protein